MSSKTVALPSSARASLPRSVLRAFVLGVFRRPLESLAQSVYTALVPAPLGAHTGARLYLTDLWEEAPITGAVLHTGLALALNFSPLVLFLSFRTLSHLDPATSERWHRCLSHHGFAIVRTAYYAGRGHALVAILRDPHARKAMLQEGER